jgi:DNA-binding XRE family transcriptional regulator
MQTLNTDEQRKIHYVLDILATQERISAKFVKFIRDSVYELRVASLEMDNLYGKAGTPEREAFRREAYAYCMGRVIFDARKDEKITQAELAKRIGRDKAYISKIEKGVIEPGVGTFYRIIDALGLRVEIVKPVY